MKTAVIVLSIILAAETIAYIILTSRYRREKRFVKKQMEMLESSRQRNEYLLEANRQIAQDKARWEKNYSEAVCRARDLELHKNEAHTAIVEACIHINNFKGASKEIAEAKRILKEYIDKEITK